MEENEVKVNENTLKDLCDTISSINQELLVELEEKGSIINSEEFVKISFISNLLEDVEFLITVSGNPLFRARHADLIIRCIVEQVIEFIYIINHKEKIPEYMGVSNNSVKLSTTDLIKAFRELGSGRYKNRRKSVLEMAQDIGETGSVSLYELYQLLSEECHNSYYFANLDCVEELETGETSLTLSQGQIDYLVVIIGRFLEELQE